jgi:hypothetical protein
MATFHLLPQDQMILNFLKRGSPTSGPPGFTRIMLPAAAFLNCEYITKLTQYLGG